MIKNDIEVDRKKAVIWGSLAILLQMAFFYAIWMNSFVADISIRFSDHPSVKPYEYFGGLDNWMFLRTVFLITMLAIMIKIFLILYSSLPGVGWKKGLYFGLMLGIIKAIPDAFNKWTLIVYPNELITLQLINGVIGYVFFGIIVSVLFHQFSVIRTPRASQVVGPKP
ncbi:MAG: hypothetical protein OEX19_15860 [Gammaproteobacteria bacterium]|nr:hypothetical protein [Gammaproteobacteria bacterium]